MSYQIFIYIFRYKQLLTYIKSAVTKNHAEKSINSILDYISTSKQMELLQNFYETTLEALRDAKNERLWFKTMTKLGKLYYDRKFTCIKIIWLLFFSGVDDNGNCWSELIIHLREVLDVLGDVFRLFS